jgi:predicted ribosome quality control (RQC) complex YloA/Tae2 family protein
MDDRLLAAIVEELATELRGRTLGKVWQLAPAALAIDFRAADARTLFVSADPSMPRIHLTARRPRELEKQSLPPASFAQSLRKQLGGALLHSIDKDEGERICRLTFEATDAAGTPHTRTLIAQLTGRSSNILLLDADSRIIDALRPPRGEGQQIGEAYLPPPPSAAERVRDETTSSEITSLARDTHGSLSAAVEEFYERLAAERTFDARASTYAARLRQEIARRRKLARNLADDLRAHGDAEEHKRAGDLLLANLSNAVRDGSRVRLTDYFAEGQPTVELEVDEHATLPAEAARRFARYSRAKRAAQEIEGRRAALQVELDALEAERLELERIVSARDETALAALEASREKSKGKRAPQNFQRDKPPRGNSRNARSAKSKHKGDESSARIRRYRSSDGYEILVGRAARDNDELTFKVARSHDLWLHAADYPGSHVVVRARGRNDEVPHRTLVEAAQLAAQFSQAKGDAKVAVHHTQRKFVSKIKGAAPGLVRLSSFRTILVEPCESVERI